MSVDRPVTVPHISCKTKMLHSFLFLIKLRILASDRTGVLGSRLVTLGSIRDLLLRSHAGYQRVLVIIIVLPGIEVILIHVLFDLCHVPVHLHLLFGLNMLIKHSPILSLLLSLLFQ